MKGDFSLAVHALVYLNHKKCSLSSEALADNICTNPVRVRKVMAMLKRAGMVSTREGSDGGYTLEVDARQLDLRRIAEATDTRFVSASWRSGDMDKECLIASGMGNIMDTLYADLDALCKKELHGKTIADIDQLIFPSSKTGKEDSYD